MKPHRSRQKIVLAGIFLWWCAVCVAHVIPGVELWPFSYFGMYSYQNGQNLVVVRLKEVHPKEGRDLLRAMNNYRFAFKAHVSGVLAKDSMDEMEKKQQLVDLAKAAVKGYEPLVEVAELSVRVWDDFQLSQKDHPDLQMTLAVDTHE